MPLILPPRPIARILVAITIIAPLLEAYFFGIESALAAPLSVSLANSLDERKLELESGQTAEVIVYLKSAGQMLDGYKLALVNNATRKSERVGSSDVDGIIHFKGISAGSYTVLLSRPKNRVGSVSVNLGDAVLKIEKSEPPDDN